MASKTKTQTAVATGTIPAAATAADVAASTVLVTLKLRKMLARHVEFEASTGGPLWLMVDKPQSVVSYTIDEAKQQVTLEVTRKFYARRQLEKHAIAG